MILAGPLAIGAATSAAVASYATFAPRSGLWCPIITRGPAKSGGIALTFDDGPWPGATEAILEILAAADIRAAFFIIGRNAQRWPDLLRRMADAGHILGNHSYDHHHFGLFGSRRYWLDQLGRTDDLIARAAGAPPAFFRPPMGFKTPLLAGAVRARGHRLIGWSRRAMDGFATTPERIIERLAAARSGEILALHDGVEPHVRRDPSPTVRALPGVLRTLAETGLRPLSLDRLLGLPAYRGAPTPRAVLVS